jgi:hypothetical protein
MKHNPLEQYLLNNMMEYVWVEAHNVSAFSWITQQDRDEIDRGVPFGFLPVKSFRPGTVEAGAWYSDKYMTIIVWLDLKVSRMVYVLKFSKKENYREHFGWCCRDAEAWLMRGPSQSIP